MIHFNIRIITYIFLLFPFVSCTQTTIEKNDFKPVTQNDIIRVVMPPPIITLDPIQDYNWSYNAQAKLQTEKKLQQLGYKVIDTGLAPKNNGHPTVIVIVEANSHSPAMAPITFSAHILRPLSTDNPILQCNETDITFRLCVAPPSIHHAQSLFQKNYTYTGKNNVALIISKICIDKIFSNFPIAKK